jgi:hypothetical protein
MNKQKSVYELDVAIGNCTTHASAIDRFIKRAISMAFTKMPLDCYGVCTVIVRRWNFALCQCPVTSKQIC